MIMKYIATVNKVLSEGIHMTGTIENNVLKELSNLPLPDYVEIILTGTVTEPCMMYRWTNCGDFCGDTWHENFQRAISQASYEYGLSESDFSLVEDEATDKST